MNEHINPVVEIKRLNHDIENIDKSIKILIEKDQADEIEIKRLRFDLDEFKAGMKENKSDKAINSALKRLDAEIKGILEAHIAIWAKLDNLDKFLNEERFKPVFDRLKELEQEYKQKALEIVQKSLSHE